MREPGIEVSSGADGHLRGEAQERRDRFTGSAQGNSAAPGPLPLAIAMALATDAIQRKGDSDGTDYINIFDNPGNAIRYIHECNLEEGSGILCIGIGNPAAEPVQDGMKEILIKLMVDCGERLAQVLEDEEVFQEVDKDTDAMNYELSVKHYVKHLLWMLELETLLREIKALFQEVAQDDNMHDQLTIALDLFYQNADHSVDYFTRFEEVYEAAKKVALEHREGGAEPSTLSLLNDMLNCEICIQQKVIAPSEQK